MAAHNPKRKPDYMKCVNKISENDTEISDDPDDLSNTGSQTLERCLKISIAEYTDSFCAIVVRFCVGNLVPAFHDDLLKAIHEEAAINAKATLKICELELDQKYLEAQCHLDVALDNIFTLIRVNNGAKKMETNECIQSAGCENIREYADEARNVKYTTIFKRELSRFLDGTAENARKKEIPAERIRPLIMAVKSCDCAAAELVCTDFDTARRIIEGETPVTSQHEAYVDTEPTANPDPSLSLKSTI